MEEAVAIDTSTYLGNRPRFMIPSDQLHPIWPPELKARQERYCLDAEQAAVDVVACARDEHRCARWVVTRERHTEEEVVGVRCVSTYPEDLYEVVELA